MESRNTFTEQSPQPPEAAGVGRYGDLTVAAYATRHEDRPAVTVVFTRDDGQEPPQGHENLTLDDAEDLARRWDLIDATEAAEAVRAAAEQAEHDQYKTMVMTFAREQLPRFAREHGRRGMRAFADVLEAAIEGRIDQEQAESLGKALSRGDLAEVEQAVKGLR